MAAKIDLEKCYNFQIGNGELAYWKYGSSPYTSLKLSGAISYYTKLVKSGVYQPQNPWIYCKQWRIAGTLSDICNITGRPWEEIMSQSFNPATPEGQEAIKNEIALHKVQAPKKEPVSVAAQAQALQEYINQNPENGIRVQSVPSASDFVFAQPAGSAAATAPSLVASANALKISQGALNKKLEIQWNNLIEQLNETVPDKKRILNISKFNKATYTGVQKQRLTKAEQGDGKRNPDKTALVVLNGRPIPFKFSLTAEAKQAALDYAEYVVKPLANAQPHLMFAQGSIMDVYNAISQTAQENRIVSKPLQLSSPAAPASVNNAMNVINSISAANPAESFTMDFSYNEYLNIADDIDPDVEGLE